MYIARVSERRDSWVGILPKRIMLFLGSYDAANAMIKPGETLGHVHATIHFQGEEKALDRVGRQALGANLSKIKRTFLKK